MFWLSPRFVGAHVASFMSCSSAGSQQTCRRQRDLFLCHAAVLARPQALPAGEYCVFMPCSGTAFGLLYLVEVPASELAGRRELREC